jgi:hypothetical protein
MPRHNDITKIMALRTLLALFCGACAVTSAFSQQQLKATPQVRVLMAHCSPDLNQSSERTFADPDLKGWKEYSNPKEVPPLDLENGEQVFTVSLSPSGRKYVRSVEYGEDSATYQSYCYDQAGILRSLSYEMRTAWGWGYEDNRVFGDSGRTIQHTRRFFDTDSNRNIPRPSQADDVLDFLKPTIYPSFDLLPFIATFNKLRVNAPQK